MGRGFSPGKKQRPAIFSPAFLFVRLVPSPSVLRWAVYAPVCPQYVTVVYCMDQTNSTEHSQVRLPKRGRSYEQVAATILTESTFSIGPAAAAPDAALAPAGCTVPVISTW